MKKPFVSVIMTVRQDADLLRFTLAALAQQTLTPNEVIITVVPAPDETWQVANKWRPNGIKVVTRQIPDCTRAAGRNRGVALSNARTNILVFTDAGCVPEPQWLQNLVTPIRTRAADVVSGITWSLPALLTIQSHTRPHTAWYEAQLPLVLVPPWKLNPLHPPLPATRNLAVTTQAWTTIGPFRTALNYAEDYEWSRRLRNFPDIKLALAPQARVAWWPRATGRDFWRMIFKLTQGDMQARTWRWGQATMGLRYIFFVAIAVKSWPLGLAIYSTYHLSHLIRRTYDHHWAYAWSIWLQILTDWAVLTGTIWGLFNLGTISELIWGLVSQKQKSDNKRNA